MFLNNESVPDLPRRCEIAVVGSGAGGAVVAYELAQAGYDVAILEEGGYHPTSSFSYDPLRMLPRLYRNAGADSTVGKTPIVFTEGRCVGGSTVVNAGICYRTPETILHRWSMSLGTRQFLPEFMEPYFRRVEQQLNVMEVPDEVMGEDSLRMRRAAEQLGYHYTRVKRNIHACQGTNLCILGCPTGAKQSTLTSYIPRAREHGAQVLPNCRVENILIRGDRAAGVQIKVLHPVSRRLVRRHVLQADAVFVAGGSIQTPVLLYNSVPGKKLKALGKYLYLHPNTKCVGVFDEDIHAWQGSIQGFQIDEFAEDGFTFGSTFLPPGILALSLPFYGEEMATLLKNYNRLSVWGVLVEDSHPGSISFRFGGQPIPRYPVTALDRDRFVEGVARLCELFFAAGARRVISPIRGFEDIRAHDDVMRLRTADIKPQALNLFTVHLLGTCRMGHDPRISVVGLDHRVHGLRNVYIADASVLPTPIRVNPMITIMAFATRAAEMFQEARAKYRRAA